MEINNSQLRIKHFTSSQMYRLCGSKKVFNTYVEEVEFEKLMNRPIKPVVKTKPMKWGSLMELFVFNILGMEYSMEHKNTKLHPIHGKYWSGTPDLITNTKIGEIKSFEPKNFCKLSLALLSKDIERVKKDCPSAYWQVVSNCAIYERNEAIIISYMPYKKDLEAIIKKVVDTDFLEQNHLNLSDYYFLFQDDIESLAYLPNDSGFSDINSFDFKVPQEDFDLLEGRVIEANKLLNK